MASLGAAGRKQNQDHRLEDAEPLAPATATMPPSLPPKVGSRPRRRGRRDPRDPTPWDPTPKDPTR
eukprot:CAMPEP_0181187880 /NCGR_PEP_ID=MMETSP1096-20121128/10810_1 /TAXON_ID=156174 ORGANISM="Chrysochromulina ericina, Strain CCMP281" /NCGR_SAMPLE_ID=MMETSP1096 /ASSEMBLY_ACC=CAM_ASM_000453 /LENGTH=65 /DNA_ID=CAMNT_0023276887 /DNA_START=297 /DNA_END=494 /DNA_ORIENTATION=-